MVKLCIDTENISVTLEAYSVSPEFLNLIMCLSWVLTDHHYQANVPSQRCHCYAQNL